MDSIQFDENKMITKIFKSKFLNDETKEEHERFTLNDYNSYQTLLIQSTTGTGKTHTILNHIKEDLEQGKTLLSIFGKQSLGKTILNYFSQYHKSKPINHYEIHRKTFAQNFIKENSFVCVNSLRKIIDKDSGISALKVKKLVENKIVYIDEISIFISETINNTKINNLYDVYRILKWVLKYAYKVIVSQSEISESAFYLLSERTESKFSFFNKSLYIVNKHKKKNIPAFKVESKEVFFCKMLDNYRNKKNFLVGSDSCKKITELYEKYVENIDDEHKKNVFLFTSETHKIDEKFKFEGKTVFYSPSIICGVDCTLHQEQDQFFYFHGDSISAELIYQQTCRTRNMKNLYFYVNPKHQDNDLYYNSIEHCIQTVKNTKHKLIKAFHIECDDSDIGKDFFNLYCKEEFHLDKYRNEKLKSFYKLLKKDGFILQENKEPSETNYFGQVVEKKIVLRDYNDLEKWIDNKETCDHFDKIKEILQINDKEIILNNKDMFLNNTALEKHLLVCSLMHNKISSSDKLFIYNNNNFTEKLIGSSISKITYLKKLEEKYEIKIFTESGKVEYTDCEMTLTNTEIDEIKSILKSRKTKAIAHKRELVSLIIEYYRNLGFTKNIISQKSNGKYKYSFNIDYINDTLELLHYRLNNVERLEDECKNKMMMIKQRHQKKQHEEFIKNI